MLALRSSWVLPWDGLLSLTTTKPSSSAAPDHCMKNAYSSSTLQSNSNNHIPCNYYKLLSQTQEHSQQLNLPHWPAQTTDELHEDMNWDTQTDRHKNTALPDAQPTVSKHWRQLHCDTENIKHFSFMKKSFNSNVIWQNLELLLLVNIIVNVTYLISGIYTNFCRLLRRKCDVINRGVM